MDDQRDQTAARPAIIYILSGNARSFVALFADGQCAVACDLEIPNTPNSWPPKGICSLAVMPPIVEQFWVEIVDFRVVLMLKHAKASHVCRQRCP